LGRRKKRTGSFDLRVRRERDLNNNTRRLKKGGRRVLNYSEKRKRKKRVTPEKKKKGERTHRIETKEKGDEFHDMLGKKGETKVLKKDPKVS